MNLLIGKRERKEYIIPHFHEDTSCGKTVREHWFENKTNNITLFISGECKTVDMMEKALNNNYKTVLLIGPTIAQSNKSLLVELKEKFNQEFKIFQLPQRPEGHSTLINNNLFFEDEHSVEGDYEWAQVIENATKSEIDFFKAGFLADVNLAKELTIEDLRNIPTYPDL